jgi:death-on-curing protein
MIVKYLSAEQVIQIHDAVLKETGGLPGLRDLNLLESAIMAPQVVVFGLEMYERLCEKAAIYLFHLIKNHPFNDGNKRTAFQTVCVFYELNGCKVSEEDAKSMEHLCVAVAAGAIDKNDLLSIYRKLEVIELRKVTESLP